MASRIRHHMVILKIFICILFIFICLENITPIDLTALRALSDRRKRTSSYPHWRRETRRSIHSTIQSQGLESNLGLFRRQRWTRVLATFLVG